METRYKTFTGLMTRLMRSIRRIKADEMADFQLKGPHVSCLYYLYDEGDMTAATLCEKCGEDKAALSRALETLGDGGYIRRGETRYKNLISLTEKGRGICEEIARRIDSVVAEAGAGLSEEERAAMYRALGTICQNLEAVCERKREEA